MGVWDFQNNSSFGESKQKQNSHSWLLAWSHGSFLYIQLRFGLFSLLFSHSLFKTSPLNRIYFSRWKEKFFFLFLSVNHIGLFQDVSF